MWRRQTVRRGAETGLRPAASSRCSKLQQKYSRPCSEATRGCGLVGGSPQNEETPHYHRAGNWITSACSSDGDSVGNGSGGGNGPYKATYRPPSGRRRPCSLSDGLRTSMLSRRDGQMTTSIPAARHCLATTICSPYQHSYHWTLGCVYRKPKARHKNTMASAHSAMPLDSSIVEMRRLDASILNKDLNEQH